MPIEIANMITDEIKKMFPHVQTTIVLKKQKYCVVVSNDNKKFTISFKYEWDQIVNILHVLF